MASDGEEPEDALESLDAQDHIMASLIESWEVATARLADGEDVDARWARGSAAKLFLQHAAVREEAKLVLAGRLEEVDQADLARRVEGDGVRRRQTIDVLDETIRGQQAITVNTSEADDALRALMAVFKDEVDEECGQVLPEARRVLGPPGQRGLPGHKWVESHSPTHPNPEERWYDRFGPLSAVKALYDHLRSTPTGGTSPAVDSGREQVPGPP